MGVYSPLTTSKADIGRREGYRWILIGVTVGDQFGKIGKLEGMMICDNLVFILNASRVR